MKYVCSCCKKEKDEEDMIFREIQDEPRVPICKECVDPDWLKEYENARSH